MRIFQILQKPQRRGAEIFAAQLTDELRTQGHDCRLCCLYPNGSETRLSLNVADLQLDGLETSNWERFPGWHPRLARSVCKAIDDFRPDVVQVNGARTVKYGAMARYWCRHREWVLVYRNIDSPTFWVRGVRRKLFYGKLVMPKVDGVVGVSKATLQHWKTLYRLERPMTHLPRAVDIPRLRADAGERDVRAELGVGPLVPVAVFVGSLSPQKRPDRLLRVFAQAKKQAPESLLWIVGDGPLRAETERLAGSLNVASAVRFLGGVANVAPYFEAATVLTLTSDTEGTPGVVLEAAALSRPTVATRVGGVEECVHDGRTGRVLDAEDESGQAVALAGLLGNPVEASRMGERARELVEELFSLERVAPQYLEFYKSVLVSKRNGSLRQ